MLMSVRTRVGIAAASVATLGLVTGGLAPAVGTDTAARMAPTPKLTVTVTKTGNTVQGPRTFKAGRVALQLNVRRAHATLGTLKLKPGYSFKAFRADVLKSFGGDIPALKRALRKSVFFGGVAGVRGEEVTGTVVLPRRGTYFLYEFGGNDLVKLAKLRVTGPRVARAVPQSDGRVVAKTGARFGGSKTFPHKGTLTFKNEATDSPHFLIMQHVAKGTTRGEVLACLNDEACQFPFGREGALETEVIDPGKTMTIDYDLPRGTYVQMCFFPDPNMGGMPHALMGMVRIVTLK